MRVEPCSSVWLEGAGPRPRPPRPASIFGPDLESSKGKTGVRRSHLRRFGGLVCQVDGNARLTCQNGIMLQGAETDIEL